MKAAILLIRKAERKRGDCQQLLRTNKQSWVLSWIIEESESSNEPVRSSHSIRDLEIAKGNLRKYSISYYVATGWNGGGGDFFCLSCCDVVEQQQQQHII